MRRGGVRRRRAPRRVRALLALLITVCVVFPLSAAARPSIPAPAPAVLPPLTAATLDTAYAANRANAARAARMAAAHGDRHRADADRALAAASRRLLAFDGRGSGRVVEVFGDLARAERVAVLVPGSDTSLDTYGRFRATATALHHRLTAEDGRAAGRVAVVAWLGYDTPGTVSTAVLTPGRADQAAPALNEFLHRLYAVTGRDTRVSLLCHSRGTGYGSGCACCATTCAPSRRTRCPRSCGCAGSRTAWCA
ncbi:hypothetical protein G7Z13_18700 [Streptomyces sp. JB150]|nr:hypothetical protein G7Z13_18700 [Streptomyces sp. JB150]